MALAQALAQALTDTECERSAARALGRDKA